MGIAVALCNLVIALIFLARASLSAIKLHSKFLTRLVFLAGVVFCVCLSTAHLLLAYYALHDATSWLDHWYVLVIGLAEVISGIVFLCGISRFYEAQHHSQ